MSPQATLTASLRRSLCGATDFPFSRHHLPMSALHVGHTTPNANLSCDIPLPSPTACSLRVVLSQLFEYRRNRRVVSNRELMVVSKQAGLTKRDPPITQQ